MRSKNFFKRLLKEAGFFFLALALISWLINTWRAPKLNDIKLPKLEGKSVQGEEIERLIIRSEPLLIHFWGTWCPVCRLEASNIDIVAKHYRVISIAVNSGSNTQVRRWLTKRNLNFPVLNDPDAKLARRFNIDIFPTTLIYDSQGKLKFIETGYSSTAGLLLRMKLAK